MEWQQLNTRVGHVRVWLNEWPRVQSMLRGQFPERRRKLYPKPPAETDIGRAQSEAADLVFSELHKLLNPVPQDKDAQELGCYEDIGYPMTAFLAHIHAAYRIRLATRRRGPVSFLDVGCGVGMKLIAARRFFARVAGVEFDPGFVRRARRMVRATGDGAIRIHKADGRLFKKYADYDVVYFFRPMRDVDDLIALEEAIVAAVRPGTLLVAPYLGFGHRSERHNCPRIDGSVYLAKASKREAASLRRRAELTGTHIDRRETRFPGLWEPILQAAAENGFGLNVTNQLLES